MTTRHSAVRRLAFPVAVGLMLAVGSCTPADEHPSRLDEQASSAGTPNRAAEAGTHAEYMDRMYDCLREQGLRVNEDIDPPEVEASGFEEAIAACEALLGPPPAPVPLTDEEITSIYRQLIDAANCLEGAGHTISDPPSIESFIETYRLSFQGGPMAWDPFSEVQGEVPACPQPTLN